MPPMTSAQYATLRASEVLTDAVRVHTYHPVPMAQAYEMIAATPHGTGISAKGSQYTR